MITHNRRVYTILNFLSEFGGFSKSILGVIVFMSSAITYNIVVAKFIKRLYKNNDNHDHQHHKMNHLDHDHVLPKRFTLCEKLYEIWWCKCILCCCLKSSKMKNYEVYSHFH